ncbi:MAG: polysaccharide biosynthesis tyrosine autokinase [Chitinophagaceae bacterium]
MAEQNVLLQGGESRTMTATEMLYKYLSYLSFFVVSFVLCWIIATWYIRYKPKVYIANTLMLVKQGEGKIRGDLIDAAMFGSGANIDNEIELIKAKSIITRAIERSKMNVRYFNQGNIRTSELYGQVPFSMEILKKGDSSTAFTLVLTNLSPTGATVNPGKTPSGSGDFAIRWGVPFPHGSWQLVLKRNALVAYNNETPYQVRWEPVLYTVAEVAGGLTVEPLNPRTTIITLSLKGSHPERNADILNAIVDSYKMINLEEKNRVADNTIEFINQRLIIVTDELSGVESNLERFRTEHKIVDVNSQLGQYMNNFNTADQAIFSLEIKKQVIGLLEDFMKDPANKDKLIPASLGIENAALSGLISKYNELSLRKERERPMQAPQSLVMADLDNQMQETRTSINQGIGIVRKELQSELSGMQSRSRLFQEQIGSIPSKERSLKEISRQQNIKEGLYLYLLQKREETAVTSASTTSSYEQIDRASYSYVPVEPNVSRIRMFAVILALIIPIGLIYLIDMLNDKVTTREDITKRTAAPVIGEVGHSKDAQLLVVADKSRSIIAEQFRIIRTNLQFLLGGKKTILVTSSVSGEGKSFISMNLAAVMAISGKKVALLEFDLRKPHIVKGIGFERKAKGISNYLAGQTQNLEELYYTLDAYPSLHIYGCGPIPPNPAELMLRPQMHAFFDILRDTYDLVIIDSAPVGLVSDSFTLNEYVNATLYVIRQRYTLKKQVDFINDIHKTSKLSNMGLVINDVKVGGRYGYYGYGNGYGYGYRYGYGYSYGPYSYGAYFDDVKHQSWWQRLLSGKKKKNRK